MKDPNRTSRWKVLLIALLPFGGFACSPAAPVLFKVVVWLGGILITTAAGHTLEKVLDGIFFRSQQKDGGAEVRGENDEKAGDIAIDKNDPKVGIYKGTMKLKHEKSNKEAIIHNPIVVRESETSWTWTLDPRVKADVLKTLE